MNFGIWVFLKRFKYQGSEVDMSGLERDASFLFSLANLAGDLDDRIGWIMIFSLSSFPPPLSFFPTYDILPLNLVA